MALLVDRDYDLRTVMATRMGQEASGALVVGLVLGSENSNGTRPFVVRECSIGSAVG